MNQPYDPNQQWGQPQQPAQPYGQPESAQQWSQPAQPDPNQWAQPQQPYAQPDPAQQWAQPAQPDPNQQWAQPQQADPAQQWGQQPAAQPASGAQPAYGAPQGFTGPGAFGPPPKSGGNGKMIALIVGGVAVVAAIGLTLFLVLGGGGRSAQEAVDGFIAAAKSNDLEGAKEFLCPELDATVDESGTASPMGDTAFDVTITDVTEDGDNATATGSVTVQGQSFKVEMGLIKNDDGDFEVCSIDAA